MTDEFSIFNSPFSEGTQKIRRNLMLLSGLSLFVGMSGELPSKFALLGVSFDASQQNTLGWFLFFINLYVLLHFIALAGIEIADWIRPFITGVFTKKKLLKHGAFDETDFIDIPHEVNEQDKQLIAARARSETDWNVRRRLGFLYNLVYLRLAIEILPPLCLGIWGLVKLFILASFSTT